MWSQHIVFFLLYRPILLWNFEFYCIPLRRKWLHTISQINQRIFLWSFLVLRQNVFDGKLLYPVMYKNFWHQKLSKTPKGPLLNFSAPWDQNFLTEIMMALYGLPKFSHPSDDSVNIQLFSACWALKYLSVENTQYYTFFEKKYCYVREVVTPNLAFYVIISVNRTHHINKHYNILAGVPKVN